MRLALLLVLLSAASAQAQWDLQNSHTTASLRGIHNVGDGIAWASGTGTVLRTVDGGHLWQPCAIPHGAEALDFRGIQAFDADTAIVMSSGKGDLSRLYKTTDGCKTWNLVFTNPDPEGFWDAIRFVDKEANPKSKGFGVLLGDPVDNHFALFLSYDSGDHWERQVRQSPAVASQGEGIFAASNSSLLVNGLMDREFVTGGKGGAREIAFWVGDDTTTQPTPLKLVPGSKEFRLASRGWQVNSLPMTGPTDSSGAFSIAEEEYKAVIVGGDYAKPIKGLSWYEGPYNPETQSDWTASKTPPHGYRSAVGYDRDHRLWITVGPTGTDISTDDGKDWRPLLKGTPGTGRNWNALSLPFAVGPKGRIGKLNPRALPPPPKCLVATPCPAPKHTKPVPSQTKPVGHSPHQPA